MYYKLKLYCKQKPYYAIGELCHLKLEILGCIVKVRIVQYIVYNVEPKNGGLIYYL